MNPRKMIYVGVFVITVSILAPTLFGLWAVFGVFQALRYNETAGVGAVVGVFETAIAAGLFMIVGILTGIVLIVVGNYKKGNQHNAEN